MTLLLIYPVVAMLHNCKEGTWPALVKFFRPLDRQPSH